MKRFALASLFIATSLGTLSAVAQSEPEQARIVLTDASIAAVQTEVAAPAPVWPVSLRGVHAAAEQGPEALRRYIFRTRMIYNHQFRDFAKPEWDQR